METGDGWLLRVVVPGGVIAPDSLDVVAEVAERFGSGVIDITSRANLQLRGLAPAALNAAADQLSAAGLAAPDGRTDALRMVVASPLAGHDPLGPPDGADTVTAVVRRLIAEVAGRPPSKFSIVVDEDGGWPLDAVPADLRLVRQRHETSSWYVVVRGDDTPIGVVRDPVSAAVAAASICAASGQRLDQVAAHLGEAAVRARLGATATATGASERWRTTSPDAHVGVHPHRQPGRRNVICAPFLGRLDAAGVRELATLARVDDIEVRLTPERSVALCGVPAGGAVDAVLRTLGGHGHVVESDDPRRLLSACVGSSGCASSTIDTRHAAADLLAGAGETGRIHVSGCPKSCGAPIGVRHLIADGSGLLRDSGAVR